eukprot:5211001-Prymnesium_polylepis.1
MKVLDDNMDQVNLYLQIGRSGGPSPKKAAYGVDRTSTQMRRPRKSRRTQEELDGQLKPGGPCAACAACGATRALRWRVGNGEHAGKPCCG